MASSPIDVPAELIDAWIHRWSEVAFEPKTSFGLADRSKTSASVQFFMINQLLAYVLLVTVSITFFFVFWRSNLMMHVRDDLSKAITTTSAIFLVYVVLLFIVTMVSSILSWAIARTLGSTASFPRHFHAALDLSAFDPIAIPAAGILVLCGSQYGWPFIVVGSLVLFACKIWCSWSGFWAFSNIHSLFSWRRWLFFLFGYVLQQIVLTTLCLGILWLLIGMALIPSWD